MTVGRSSRRRRRGGRRLPGSQSCARVPAVRRAAEVAAGRRRRRDRRPLPYRRAAPMGRRRVRRPQLRHARRGPPRTAPQRRGVPVTCTARGRPVGAVSVRLQHPRVRARAPRRRGRSPCAPGDRGRAARPRPRRGERWRRSTPPPVTSSSVEASRAPASMCAADTRREGGSRVAVATVTATASADVAAGCREGRGTSVSTPSAHGAACAAAVVWPNGWSRPGLSAACSSP